MMEVLGFHQVLGRLVHTVFEKFTWMKSVCRVDAKIYGDTLQIVKAKQAAFLHMNDAVSCDQRVLQPVEIFWYK